MMGELGVSCLCCPKMDNEAGLPIGSTTGLHFTVLGFISGTGEADVSLTKSQLAYPLSFKEDVDGLITI
jgi:hypothetical protein